MKKTQNINPNQILGKVTKFDETWMSYLEVIKQNLPGELFLYPPPPPPSPRFIIIKEQRVWKLMITFIKIIAKCYVCILWEHIKNSQNFEQLSLYLLLLYFSVYLPSFVLYLKKLIYVEKHFLYVLILFLKPTSKFTLWKIMTRPWLELPINKLGVNEKRKIRKSILMTSIVKPTKI